MKCTGLKAVSYPDTRMIIKGSTVQFGTDTRIFYIVCYSALILTKMEEVKGFKLTDGRIIENKDEAIKLQKEIDFKKAVWDFAQREGVYEAKDTIYDAIIDNVEELHKIFNAL